jgi:cation transport ATPase
VVSEHPVAAAILAEAAARTLPISTPEDFAVVPGEGISGSLTGAPVAGGSERLMARHGVAVSHAVRERVEAMEGRGCTVVHVAEGGRLVGLVRVADTLRPEVPEALARLRQLGIRRLMLVTGDPCQRNGRRGGSVSHSHRR